MTKLPEPTPDARRHSDRLCSLITEEIRARGGWMPFSRYMELALYAPGLGYYSGGARKFGSGGDFVTAPEISPLFGAALANQVAQVLAASAPHVLEAGAGTGALAADLLLALERLGCAPERYAILELSGELRERQRATLAERAPALLDRVSWLDRLPETFSGCVVGNELLDAMPVHLIHWTPEGVRERGVALDVAGAFSWEDRLPDGAVLEDAARLAMASPYLSEINLAARAWVAEWARILGKGALILLDYGFPEREFYHPQRNQGTLMCHYRHQAHGEPFHLPGLTDITAHVDFTAVAEAGHNAGLDVLGYTTQAQFLLNAGVTELLLAHDAARDTAGSAYLKLASGVQKLLSPSEMGELFKVIALGRGLEDPLIGFLRGDRCHTL